MWNLVLGEYYSDNKGSTILVWYVELCVTLEGAKWIECMGIIYKYWPDTREFITRTVELYTNIDQTLVNSLHGRLNCEIGGLDCHVITWYMSRVH